MTVEQAKKANELVNDLKKNLDEQHKILIGMIDILTDYQKFMLEQLKKARENV